MAVEMRTQILVRSLEGRTLCVPHSGSILSGAALKSKLAALTKIPAQDQRLAAGTRDVLDDTILVARKDGTFPPCSLLLRLLGGKGGFGSLLRGATSKAGQKKTSNFDACRDMNGRRLRHVNAEKQLKEWTAGQPERELEKAGEEFIKKLAKEKKETQSVAADLNRIREENAETMDRVSSAVESGLKEARKQVIAQGKRKAAEEQDAPHKRSKLLSMLQEMDEDDEDDDEEEEEEEEGEEENAARGEGRAHTSSPTSQSGGAGPSSSGDSQPQPPAEPISDSDDARDGASGSPEASPAAAGAPPAAVAAAAGEAAGGGTGAEAVHGGGATGGDVSEGPLDLDRVERAEELEALGLDRLKIELQARGLKCGGSAPERAARLFLLKATPLEKLDRKHFAKPANGGGGGGKARAGA